jgi:hypothetical protein
MVAGACVTVAAMVLLLAGCSPRDENRPKVVADETTPTRPATETPALESFASICPSSARRGSVQVARVAPEVEEGGVAFGLLGDGVGPGVLLCRDTLYADANALMKLMGERDSVVDREGTAVLGARLTRIPVYQHDGVPYVEVAALARDRRALMLQRGEQRQDAVVWPQPALRHLKASGLTEGDAYKDAVREGLIR